MSTNDAPRDFAALRQQLECEKLQVEIDNARLAWWKRPAYLGGLVPVALAAIAYASASTTGWFDLQRQRLDNRVAELRQEVSQLEADRQTALNDVAEARRQLDSAYLKAVNAVDDVNYGAAHSQIVGHDRASLDDLRRRADELGTPLGDELAGAVEEFAFLMDMAEMTRDIAEETAAAVRQIPASDHLQGSQFDPLFAQAGLRRLADGRVLDVETLEELDEAQIERRINPPIGQP